MESAERPYVFAAKIEKIWIMRVIDIPGDIGKAIRKMAGETSRHIPVHGWIEGLPFQNTLVPRGGGNYRMHVHSRIWRKLRIDAGAAVEVTMLLDREPREAAETVWQKGPDPIRLLVRYWRQSCLDRTKRLVLDWRDTRRDSHAGRA